jgi:hypothetical protein
MSLRVARGCVDLAATRPCVCVVACASRGWPGSIPKARSDLRSGQGARTPMAVLVLCLCDVSVTRPDGNSAATSRSERPNHNHTVTSNHLDTDRYGFLFADRYGFLFATRRWYTSPLHHSAICCNAAPPLQRSTMCCNEAPPVAAQRCAATDSCRDETTPSADSCRLRTTGGCDRPQSAVESLRARRRRTECVVGHPCGTIIVVRCTVVFLPLGEHVSCTCCVCAQRSGAGYGSPL